MNTNSNQPGEEAIKMKQLFFMCVLMTCVALSSGAIAQEDKPTQQELRDLIAGTWSLDLEKSKAVMDAGDFKKVEASNDNIQLIFGDDGSLEMIRGGSTRKVSYQLKPVKDSDTDYQCLLETGGREMSATISFLEENVIRLTPDDGASPAILVRPAREYSLAEARSFLIGNWKSDADATTELAGETELPEGGIPDLEIRFLKDGTVEALQDGEKAPEGGRFELSELAETDKKNHFSLETRVDDDVRKFEVEIAGSKKILLKPADKFTIVFNRLDD